jgi:hypothetical protein
MDARPRNQPKREGRSAARRVVRWIVTHSFPQAELEGSGARTGAGTTRDEDEGGTDTRRRGPRAATTETHGRRGGGVPHGRSARLDAPLR